MLKIWARLTLGLGFDLESGLELSIGLELEFPLSVQWKGMSRWFNRSAYIRLVCSKYLSIEQRMYLFIVIICSSIERDDCAMDDIYLVYSNYL